MSNLREKQIHSMLETLDDTYKEKCRIAKKMGVSAPPVPSVESQLNGAEVKLNHLPKKASEDAEGKDYVVIPSIHLKDGTTTRPMWCRLEVAAQVGDALKQLAKDNS